MDDTTEQEIKELTETLAHATKETDISTQEQREAIPDPCFQAFQTAGDDKLETILGGFTGFCESMSTGSTPRWLTIVGDSGTGKSMLSELAHKWVTKNFRIHKPPPNYVIALRDIMFVKCKDIVDREKATNWTFTRRMCEAHFLVLDDLGSPRDVNGFLADCYARICEERLGKWTIITTNKPLAQIADEIDARIASRMIRGGSVVIETDAGDWNLR